MCFDIIGVFVASLSKHGLALLLLQTKHVSMDVEEYKSASHFTCFDINRSCHIPKPNFHITMITTLEP